VRGDLQPFNNQENYAATLVAKVFRSLMAITAVFDLEAVQLDAISAFTKRTLDEEVYTYMPEGFKAPGKLLTTPSTRILWTPPLTFDMASRV
jgi:hypothetical protein